MPTTKRVLYKSMVLTVAVLPLHCQLQHATASDMGDVASIIPLGIHLRLTIVLLLQYPR